MSDESGKCERGDEMFGMMEWWYQFSFTFGFSGLFIIFFCWLETESKLVSQQERLHRRISNDWHDWRLS
jgi:hypothetical protein